MKKCDYSLEQIDVFAAYVIPENAWYLIPAVLLLGKRRKTMAALCPVVPPAKKASYCYERYRENWDLLKKSKDELLQFRRERAVRTHHRKAISPTLPHPDCANCDLRFERARP